MKYYLITWESGGYHLITDTNQCTLEFSDLENIENQLLDRIWIDPKDLVEGKITPAAFKSNRDTLLATFDQHPTIEFIVANHPEILL